MTRTISKLGLLVAAMAGLGSLGAAPAQADWRIGIDINECRPDYGAREERIWVEPVYRNECTRVWVEPTYTTVSETVWIPEQYEDREIIHRRNGREWREHVRVVISPGHAETRLRQIETTPGHWEEVTRQVLVCPGHWETRVVRERSRRHDDNRFDRFRIEIGRRW